MARDTRRCIQEDVYKIEDKRSRIYIYIYSYIHTSISISLPLFPSFQILSHSITDIPREVRFELDDKLHGWVWDAYEMRYDMIWVFVFVLWLLEGNTWWEDYVVIMLLIFQFFLKKSTRILTKYIHSWLCRNLWGLWVCGISGIYGFTVWIA